MEFYERSENDRENQDIRLKNSTLQDIVITLLLKYKDRFRTQASRLSWFDILSSADKYVDVTTNCLERSNREFGKTLELSHKRRCIDKICVLCDFLYYRSLNFLANFKIMKPRSSPEANKKRYVRQRLIRDFRIRENKEINFDRIYLIIIDDLQDQ